MRTFLLLFFVSCVLAKLKSGQKRGEHLWKKKVAAVQARTDFNQLWDNSLAYDKELQERPGRGGATRSRLMGKGMGLTEMFTDDTKTERLLLFNNARSRIQELEKDRSGRGNLKLKENYFALMTVTEKERYLGVNITLNREEISKLPTPRLGASAGNQQPPPPKHSLIRQGSPRGKRASVSDDTLDWRDYGVVTPVKNQGSCGSCWAFGSVAVLEGAYKLATGNAKNFSEQQVVDCNSDYGCSGGWWVTVWDDVEENDYISLEEDYEYAGSKTADDCSRTTTNGMSDASVTGYEIIRESDGEATMLSNLESYGPIAICIYVDETVYYYDSGYIDSCLGEDCNHLVTLVGYDADALIIKNSWGTNWGLDGYLKVKRGCTDDGYSYWASFVYVVSDGSSSDDSADDSADDDEEEEYYVSVFTTTDVVKKQDYDIDGVQSGDIFTIKGTDASSSSNAKWFLNIMDGKNIAYHVEFQRSKSRYRQNYKEDGSWGSKITGDFPSSVTEDDDFELYITVTDSGFDTVINDEELMSFSHVIDVDDIDSIEVGGGSASFDSITQSRLDSSSASSGTSDEEDEEEEEEGEATNRRGCFDFQMYCSYWAGVGHCEDAEYDNWMKIHCPKACGLCG